MSKKGDAREHGRYSRAAQERDETERGQRLTVSAREHSTTARACQTARAQRILSPMLTTASSHKWTRILDALLDLFAKWTQSQ